MVRLVACFPRLANCPSDYNFAPSETGECMPVGPESIPLNSCTRDGDKFFGSSGYRLIPGDSCVVPSGGGKDKKIEKDCKSVEAVPGLVSHKVFNFPGMVLDQVYFEESHVRPSALLVETG